MAETIRVKVAELPEGFAIEWDGQRYWLSFVEPYTNRHGNQTWLLTWDTTCPSCGKGFSIQTGRTFRAPVRRCEPCRMPGRRVRAHGG